MATALIPSSTANKLVKTNEFIEQLSQLFATLPDPKVILSTDSEDQTAQALQQYANVLAQIDNFQRLLVGTIRDMKQVPKDNLDDILYQDQIKQYANLFEEQLAENMQNTAEMRQKSEHKRRNFLQSEFDKLMDQLESCSIYMRQMTLQVTSTNLVLKKHYSQLVEKAGDLRYTGKEQIQREEGRLQIEIVEFAKFKLELNTDRVQLLTQVQKPETER